MLDEFTKRVTFIISRIPEGKVLTYGRVAALAGKPYGARQVSWILHSLSKKHNLPWHRVINSQGKISLRGQGFDLQKELLVLEGIKFSQNGKIELQKYLWNINSMDEIR